MTIKTLYDLKVWLFTSYTTLSFVITMPHITSIGKAKKEHQYVSPVRQKSTNWQHKSNTKLQITMAIKTERQMQTM